MARGYVWYHRDLAKSNQICPYCGRHVGTGSTIPSNKEHLIGKQFVPVGGFRSADAFNFIFRCCVECNAAKADAERHVSTVSMYRSADRAKSQVVDRIAIRKADRDYQPSAAGKTVSEATAKHSLSTSLGPGITFSASFVGPPPLDRSRAVHLAYRHVQGLFVLITSGGEREVRKLLPPEQFYLQGIYPRTDWGNPQMVEVVRRTRPWEWLALIDTADGFFRATIKRPSAKSPDWYWALEWNKSYRLLGGIGPEFPDSDPYRDLPALSWAMFPTTDGTRARFRQEIPTHEITERMFEEE